MNDNQKSVTVDGIEYRLRLEQDSDAQDPFDNDEGLGAFYSFHRHAKKRQEGIEALENNPDAVALSVYSHSGEVWRVKGDTGINCPWDTVQVAGCWIPNAVLLGELKGLKGQERKAKCMLFARQAMETLNQYLSGDVWGYIVEKRNHCPTCQHDDWEHLDSCWGFYGQEYAMQEAESVLKHYTEKKVA